jgi:hypothetical protein
MVAPPLKDWRACGGDLPDGKRVGLATLAAFALVVVLVLIPDPAEWMKVLAAGLMLPVLVGLVVTLYLKLTHMGSFMKRKIHPKLVRALAAAGVQARPGVSPTPLV